VKLVRAASRKSHGPGSSFDIDLPLVGNPGIECRSGGPGGDYTVVFTFADPIATVGGAAVTGGSGSVSSRYVDPADAHGYIVNLSGVQNAQQLTITLTDVTDSAGDTSRSVSTVMTVLVGDTTGDGFVNSADIGQTKSQSGQVVTTSNFRADVNADGLINSADIGLVKSESGTALP
jgi:hypothetical protein